MNFVICKKTKIGNVVWSFSENHLGFNMHSEVYYSEFIDITVLIIAHIFNLRRIEFF